MVGTFHKKRNIGSRLKVVISVGKGHWYFGYLAIFIKTINCIVWIIYNIKLCDFNITLKVQLYSFLLLFNTSGMDKRLKGGGSVIFS